MAVTTFAWQSASLHLSAFDFNRPLPYLPLYVPPRSGDRSRCKYGFAAASHLFHRPDEHAGQLHTQSILPMPATATSFAFQGGIQVFTQRPNRLKLISQSVLVELILATLAQLYCGTERNPNPNLHPKFRSLAGKNQLTLRKEWPIAQRLRSVADLELMPENVANMYRHGSSAASECLFLVLFCPARN